MSGGVYVRSLFKLLRRCDVPQQAVVRHIGASRGLVSMWANGQRPLPLHHREAFERFVWAQLARTNDRYLGAMEQVLGPDVERWMQGDVGQEPLLFKDPGPEAPLVVQEWWAFHLEALRLMDDWETELQQSDLVAELGSIRREIARSALDDDDKLASMISGPERAHLLRQAARQHEILKALDRTDATSQATVGRRLLMKRLTAARGGRT